VGVTRDNPDRRRAGGALGLILVGLFALALIPSSALGAMPSLCLWHRLHLPCWGCGSVRALASLVHGHPARAWEYNHNIILTAPLLLALLVTTARETIRQFRGFRRKCG